MAGDHYDVIVIGSGPGGATVAQTLATTGKRILILERGGYLKREIDNWSIKAVFGENRYRASETWFDSAGKPFNPSLHYHVGGNSKVYGSALVRMRREDFGVVHHSTGVSPAWPLGYDAFDPYYLEAEALYHVHGRRGEDPNEPNASDPFPHPPVEHEPRIARLSEALTRRGYKPFHLPLGILLDQRPDGSGLPTPGSACIRCGAFDGFPCLTNGKADAQIVSVDPMLARNPNVTLLTGANVTTLDTDASGRTITGVNVLREGGRERYTGDVVVVACGALSSALLFLRSANGAHPNGLANGSDQVGRNYMRHIQSVLLAISRERNDTVFQKTLAMTDFYFGTKDWPYPMGLVQMCGKVHGEQVRGEAMPAWLAVAPSLPAFNLLARHALDFWLSSEDLPDPANRVTLARDGAVSLALTENNTIAHIKLRAAMEAALAATNERGTLRDRTLTVGKPIGIDGVSHQAGTLRFGTDPRASVLDTNCRAHEVDNLYVTDSSVFPSVGAMNPTLTIIANALRVADVIAARLATPLPARREARIERHAAVDE